MQTAAIKYKYNNICFSCNLTWIKKFSQVIVYIYGASYFMTQNILFCYKVIWDIKYSFPEIRLVTSFALRFSTETRKNALSPANTSTLLSIFVFHDLYQNFFNKMVYQVKSPWLSVKSSAYVMHSIPSIKKHFQETCKISNCLIFFADQSQFSQKKFVKNTLKSRY